MKHPSKYRFLQIISILTLVLDAALPAGWAAARGGMATATPEATAQLTLGGGPAVAAHYVQTDSAIGQNIILGAGASAHFLAEPTFSPPLTHLLAWRNAARLWAFYE